MIFSVFQCWGPPHKKLVAWKIITGGGYYSQNLLVEIIIVNSLRFPQNSKKNAGQKYLLKMTSRNNEMHLLSVFLFHPKGAQSIHTRTQQSTYFSHTSGVTGPFPWSLPAPGVHSTHVCKIAWNQHILHTSQNVLVSPRSVSNLNEIDHVSWQSGSKMHWMRNREETKCLPQQHTWGSHRLAMDVVKLRGPIFWTSITDQLGPERKVPVSIVVVQGSPEWSLNLNQRTSNWRWFLRSSFTWTET